MRRIVFVLIVVALLLPLAGCKKAPPPPPEIPTTVVPPNTMKVADLVAIVREFIIFEEGFELKIEDAEVWDHAVVSDDDDIVYFFDRADYEIVLFANRSTGNFVNGYLRSRWINDDFFLELLTIAAAFVRALEPVEYENMLNDALEKHVLDEREVDIITGEESIFAFESSSKGEVWTVLLLDNNLINIFVQS